MPNYFPLQASTEWTWCGANTQISEIEKMRSRAARPKENLYKTSLQTKLRYDPETLADNFSREFLAETNATATNKSLLSKLNPFKRKMPHEMKRHSIAPGSELDPQKYLCNTQLSRSSVSSLSRSYFSHHRPSMFAMPCMEEEQNLLETVTIADLIRAIEQVNADNVMRSELVPESGTANQRRLGTNNFMSRRSSTQALHPRHNSSHTIHGPSSDILPLKPSLRNRLNSCIGVPSMESSDNSRGKILGDANPFIRNLSIRPPPPYVTSPSEAVIKPALKRRFSVRPSNLDKAPGQFHKTQNSQIIASTPTQQALNFPVPSFQRKLSWRPTPSSLIQSNETQKQDQKKADSTSSGKPT